MRLGGFYGAEAAAELAGTCETLDRHGLSAILAPERLIEMSDEECAAYGREAARLGIRIGEAGMWDNLLVSHPDLRAERIARVRQLLAKADLMQCHAVVTLVGSHDVSDSPIAPHPDMLSASCRAEFLEITKRIMDGMELEHTRYAIEPWIASFFYEPEEIAAFLDDVGDPRVCLHLDLANMVSRTTFFATGTLAERTFDLLETRIAGAHLKDLVWDPDHVMLRWDETVIGDGVLQFEPLLQRLARLEQDTACFCEHFETEREYLTSFMRLHDLATRSGVRFLGRGESRAISRATVDAG